ncbi:MAG: hypothetical protein Q4C22_06755 [Bacillota bacterium]|nr:hypothetical protein [Bacillota bacterium]
MFRERRSYRGRRWILPVVAALILGFGYWINQGTNEGLLPGAEEAAEETASPGTSAPGSSATGQGGISLPTDESRQEAEDGETGHEEEGSGGGPSESGERYYLLRESENVVRLYYCDEEGQESYVRDTEIAFSLLSGEDQELFSQGLLIRTKAELDELLQDFES